MFAKLLIALIAFLPVTSLSGDCCCKDCNNCANCSCCCAK